MEHQYIFTCPVEKLISVPTHPISYGMEKCTMRSRLIALDFCTGEEQVDVDKDDDTMLTFDSMDLKEYSLMLLMELRGTKSWQMWGR